MLRRNTDKKRRKKTTIKNQINKQEYEYDFHTIAALIYEKDSCGIVSKRFKFRENFALGHYEFHCFEGLYMSVYDAVLKHDFTAKGFLDKNFLELSFLIEGEQIIKLEGVPYDLVCESQEGYMVYLPEVKGSVFYSKNKKLKEVKIRMSTSFIEKHQLNDDVNLIKTYSIFNFQKEFVQPLNSKKQEILSEILEDQRSGLLKRLFLESKTLELIGLQIDSLKEKQKNTLGTMDNLVKKLYQVQHIISSNMSIHHSIQNLSKQIGLNDFVLKKEYKRVFGQTIFEYASELRMNKAKQLLQNSQKPIYEISEIIGYKNPTHFTAAFKKNTGITPKKFRIAYQQKNELFVY